MEYTMSYENACVNHVLFEAIGTQFSHSLFDGEVKRFH